MSGILFNSERRWSNVSLSQAERGEAHGNGLSGALPGLSQSYG